MTNSTILLFFTGTAAAFTGSSILFDLFWKDRARIDTRVNERLKGKLKKKAQASSLLRNLGKQVSDELKPDFKQKIELLIEQSGLELTPNRFWALTTVSALVLASVGYVALGGILFTLPAAAAGALLPVLYVRHKCKQRREKMLTQLSDAFDLMGRTLRAGHTFWTAVLSVSKEFEAPLGPEMAYCHQLQNLGVPSETALREFARRSGLVETRILVEAVTVQQQTGGNLGEILDSLRDVVRERFRIRGKIKMLTSEGRMQAAVLLALPIGVGALIGLVRFEHIETLFGFNNGILAGGIVAMETIGAIWIKKIVSLDY
jgi:tight adherence protein B